MKIVALEIENFRGIQRGTIRFKEHPVLVGANNTGKTTIIEAIALLLGRDRLIRDLTEHDFFGSNPQPQDRIKLIATLSGFDGDDPDRNIEWFREGRGIPKWLDETTGIVHPMRDQGAWKLCCQIGFQAYFDQDSLNVETVRYFHDGDNTADPFTDAHPTNVHGRLIQQVGFYLVRASRTWDRVFSWGSELFRRTINAANAQPSAALMTERDRLRAPTNPLEDDTNLEPLIRNVNSELAAYLSNAPRLQLRLTSTDSRSVMDAVFAHFAGSNGLSVPAARQGSGLLSLQGLLLLLELGRLRAASGDGFLMALEEPELHLPPASQQQLIQRVQALSTQTIITTHAPAVASAADPTSVLILRNRLGILSAEPFMESAITANAANWERRFFQHGRTAILAALMQSSILVPEGRSEYHLFEILLRALMLRQGWAADTARNRTFALDVGLVPTEDAQIIEITYKLTRLHDRVCCLVDGDDAGREYARQLRAQEHRPSAVLSWHAGAALEDIIGWIMRADESVIPLLADLCTPAPTSIEEIVAYLKSHKIDLVTYEAVSLAISQNQQCSSRASLLFDGMACACMGEATNLFTQNADGLLVFQP